MTMTTEHGAAAQTTIMRKPSKGQAKDTPWKKGRLFIAVEQSHIDEALRASSSHCAIAMAIQSTLPTAKFIAVDVQCIRFTLPERQMRFCFLTPHAARELVINFDQGEECRPVSFSMKPAFIAKSGRSKQRHTPTDAELVDFRLKVAPVQAHIPAGKSAEVGFKPAPVAATPAEQELVNHWKPTDHERDPWAHDGPIAPRKPPRQARAKVSTARKGSVPTTLGGKMPPTSILSRREFGLRQCRK
jgi:hypothetical protein